MRAHRYLLALLAVVPLVASAPACASRVYGTGGRYYGAYQQRAFDQGYRMGREYGRQDLNHHLEASYSRHPDYRSADRGYRNDDGSREVYRQNFRQGFEAGYHEQFDHNTRP